MLPARNTGTDNCTLLRFRHAAGGRRRAVAVRRADPARRPRRDRLRLFPRRGVDGDRGAGGAAARCQGRAKIIRRCGAASLLGCIIICNSAEGSVEAMAFRTPKISDPHLSKTKPYFVDNFVRIGEALRAAKPDLVINTGDISLD